LTHALNQVRWVSIATPAAILFACIVAALCFYGRRRSTLRYVAVHIPASTYLVLGVGPDRTILWQTIVSPSDYAKIVHRANTLEIKLYIPSERAIH
jgi:hypothetical protein